MPETHNGSDPASGRPTSRRLVAIAAVAAAFMATLAVTSSAAGAAAAPVPWLKTVGSKIVTANGGQEVTLRGANVLRSEWDLSVGADRARIPLLASQWHGNVILRGFASDPVNSADGQYLAMLDEHVSLAEANRMYVIFAWRSHAVHGDQPSMPDDRAQQALVTLAQRYRGRPSVMYALQVEPHDVSWNQLQPRYVQMVDAIRVAASPYEPIIMIPGTDWSRDVSAAITNPVPRENIVYKTHPYNNSSQFQHQFIDAYDAGLPVFVGEFGPVQGAMTMADVNVLLTMAHQRNIGWAAWILDDETGSTALVTGSATADPTSPYGIAVRNDMVTTPTLPGDAGPPTASINDTSFQYSGSWQTSTGPAKFQGDDHFSDVANSSYQVTFTGTRVTIYAATAPWHGKATVSIDGGAATTVDFYSASRVDQAPVYASSPLAAAGHVLTVRVTGTKNANSTETVVTADRAEVTTAAATPPAGA